MAHIQVHGRGVMIYVTEISPEIAEELTRTGVSIDRFEAIRASEKTHAAGIHDDMEVFVDGRRITAPPETQSPETPLALEPGKHYLIVKETAEGRWLDIDAADPFDPEKLAAKVSTYLLSDGESITVTEVEYQGASAVGKAEAVDEDATVIFPGGVALDVLITGDEDDELADEDDEDDEDELLIVTSSAVAKPPAKKAPAQKSAAKKPAVKKPPAKKPPAKASAKKTAGKKSPAKKPAAKTSAPKKASAKKPAPKKTPARKRAANKAQAKKTVAKTAPAKKKGGRSKK